MGNFNKDFNSGQRRDFGKRSFGGHGGPKEMHKAVCGKCGKNCEVPFEPTDGRPVFCSDCFVKKDSNQSAPRTFQDRAPRPQNDVQFEALNRKLDKILEILSTNPEKIIPVEKTNTSEKKKTKISKK